MTATHQHSFWGLLLTSMSKASPGWRAAEAAATAGDGGGRCNTIQVSEVEKKGSDEEHEQKSAQGRCGTCGGDAEGSLVDDCVKENQNARELRAAGQGAPRAGFLIGLRLNTSKAGGREEVSRVEKELGGGVQTKAGDRAARPRWHYLAAGRAGELRRVGTGLRRESGGIDEERREKEEDFEGESVDKECVSAIGDLLNSDGDGLWEVRCFGDVSPCAHERDAPLAKAANTNGGIPLRRSRRKAGTVEEDSTIADATKPRKRSNPEQAGTVEEDSTIADATKPRTRSNTKATTVPAAPKPFKKPARRAKGAGRSVPAGDGNGAGDEEEAPRGRSRKRATATATEDPAPRPLPRPLPRPCPRTPDAQADTADTQPEAPSLDSASADPFSMRRRGPLEYQPPLVPPGLIGLRFDLTGEEDPSLDVDSTPAVVRVKREPDIDGLEIDLAGEEDLLEENPFASDPRVARTPLTRPGTLQQLPRPNHPHHPHLPHLHLPPAAPAPQPAPAPAPAPEPAHPTPAPAPPAPPAPAPDPPAQPPSPARSHRSRSPSSEPSDSDDDYERTEAEKKMMREKQRARNIPVDDPSDDDSEQDEQEFADDDVAMEIFKEEEGAGLKRGKGKAASKAKSSSVKSKAPAGKTSKTAAAAGTSKAGAAARKSRKAKAKQAAEVGPTDTDIAFEAAIAGEDENKEADDDGHPSGAKKRGPIPADMRRRVLDAHKAYLAQIQTIATDTGTSSKILHQLVGTTVKKPRKTSAWNMWQAKYADEHPKAEEDKTEEEGEDEDETAPRKSYNKRSRDAFVEACGDIDPKDTAAVLAHLPELAEWRKILVEKAVADARNKGTLRTKIQTEMKPAIQI
ncbi:hypothetical protein B0H16DRAFT_1471073, partial [Mycena metata]